MKFSPRLILALLGGALVAMVLTVAGELLGHALFPPTGALPAAPTTAMLLAVLLAHLAGAGGGAWTAVRLGPERPLWLGLVVGLVMLSGAVSNLRLLPHPLWFAVADLAGIATAAWLGARCAARGAGRAESDTGN
ncbi:MAG: hypothetical protein WC326_04510 [Candidatus Delongbacteria bacterium]